MNDDLYYYNKFSGADIEADCDNGVIEKLSFSCVSTQTGTPTPTTPIPILSSGDEGSCNVSVNGVVTSIDYPDGYVGGSLPNGVFDTDEYMKLGKVVLNGSESGWTLLISGCVKLPSFLNGYDDDDYAIHSILCSHLTSQTQHALFANTAKGIAILGAPTNALYIRISDSITTLAQAKTWLASNPTTVYYQLATPTAITLDIPQIELYEGINYITTTNAVKPSLEIEAWANRK